MDQMIVEFLKRIVGTLLRHGLALLFATLGLNGAFSDEQVTNWGIALAGIVVAVGWSIYQKWTSEKAVEKALELPPGTPREVLEKKL